MKPPGHRNQSEITKADYDFSGVISKPSNSELQACHFYEYARESRAAIAETASIRGQIKLGAKCPGKLGPRVQKPSQAFKLLCLASIDVFPDSPWQILTIQDKQHLMKCVSSIPKIASALTTIRKLPLSFGWDAPDTATLNDWKLKSHLSRQGSSDGDQLECGFLAINLKFGEDVLVESFKQQLRMLKGKSPFEPPLIPKKPGKSMPSGRKSIPDALNALAAMRLRFHCQTFAEAKAKLEDTDGMSLYKRRDNFNRACDRAVVHFQNAFGWLDPAVPIHFTQDWLSRTPK